MEGLQLKVEGKDLCPARKELPTQNMLKSRYLLPQPRRFRFRVGPWTLALLVCSGKEKELPLLADSAK